MKLYKQRGSTLPSFLVITVILTLSAIHSLPKFSEKLAFHYNNQAACLKQAGENSTTTTAHLANPFLLETGEEAFEPECYGGGTVGSSTSQPASYAAPVDKGDSRRVLRVYSERYP